MLMDRQTDMTSLLWVILFSLYKAMELKMTFVWDVAPCCLVDVDRRFSGD